MSNHFGPGWERHEREQEARRLSEEPDRSLLPTGEVFRDGPGERELAICHFFNECGTYAETARFFQMSVYEVQKLSHQPWWADEINALRIAEAAANNARFTKVLNMALTKLETRLEEGDVVIDKNGGEHFVPVDAGTLVKAIDVIFDKRQLVRNMPTAITENDKKLGELADKLAQLGAALANKALEASK